MPLLLAQAALFALLVSSSAAAYAQTSGQTGADTLLDAPQPIAAQAPTVTRGAPDQDLSLKGTPSRLSRDEWGVVSSPARMRKRDLRWLLPLAGAAAAAIATDSRALQNVVSKNAAFNGSNDTVSSALRDAFIAVTSGCSEPEKLDIRSVLARQACSRARR